jgi:arylsulfatase A-like enzyme
MTRRKFVAGALGGTAALGLANGLREQTRPEQAQRSAERRPNIILMMADDMGFSDIGCYGSEIHTPNLDKLAAGGLRFRQFYNSPRCCPSRAALLTGLYSHQAGFGLMADNYGSFSSPAYSGDLNDRCVTIAEALKLGGYQTAMAGKWHLTPPMPGFKHNWPLQRGFDHYFGTIAGAGSFFDPATLTRDNESIRAGDGFYYTDAIGDHATRFVDQYSQNEKPFFLYVAFTSPHWPLQALEEDIARYADRYKTGWDVLRAERHERMMQMGLVEKKWGITPRDPRVPPWELASYKDWEARRMAVYAAQIDRMDQNIGKIVSKLEQRNLLDNTLILFLSDNGGNYEELAASGGAVANDPLFRPHETFEGKLMRAGNKPSIMPGPADTYTSYGIPWGNVSNTPFRQYKHYAHEGGISTPLVAHWPNGIREKNRFTSQVGHEIDIMATCLDITGITYPTYQNRQILPLEGKSLLPVFQGKQREGHATICWEHEGNSAIRQSKWKLVSAYPDWWELYDMEADRTEMHNLADRYPDKVKELTALYQAWAKRVGVENWPLPGMTAIPTAAPAYLKHDR